MFARVVERAATFVARKLRDVFYNFPTAIIIAHVSTNFLLKFTISRKYICGNCAECYEKFSSPMTNALRLLSRVFRRRKRKQKGLAW